MEDKYEFIEPKNPTDPIVEFDPEFDVSHVVKPYTYVESTEDHTNESKLSGAQTRYEGVMIPIIQINDMVIQDQNINKVEIKIENFLPELFINVFDSNDSLQKLNSPGMTSKVIVILTAPIEGVSKKISLSFYIIDSKANTDGTIDITGEFDGIGLKQQKNAQIGSDKLSTYDFLSQLAKDLKLGFAVTEKCKDVADSRYRQVYSQTYIDYIKDQLTFAGDEESVFDAWIDQFGYLVMVNLSYVMSEQVDAKQLTMNITKGMNLTDKKDIVEDEKYEETFRLITNSKEATTISNIRFTKWETITKNDCVQNNGTAAKCFYMEDIGDTNTIQTKEFEIIEPSVDGLGLQDDYKFEKCEFLGFEMSDDSPILIQKKIVNNFKTLMNYKQIHVEMENPNYYLQRGMLVNVIFADYDFETEKVTMYNSDNTMKGASDENGLEDKGTSLEALDKQTLTEATLNNQSSVTNNALSGLYYINGMSFYYDQETEGIKQSMYLVKRGIRNNIINTNTSLNMP